MSKTNVLEDRVADEADAQSSRAAAATAATLAAGALLRHKARTYADDIRSRISDLGERARDFRGQALDLGGQARSRVRGFRDGAWDEVERRRHTAAEHLVGLANVLRPVSVARRRKLAVIGGSGVALTVAIGAGVALGFVLSRELKKRAQAKAAQAAATDTSPDAPPALANGRDPGNAADVVSDLGV